MANKKRSFFFHEADEYAFLYENAHLLLVSWRRDDTKFLYLIRGERETGEVDLSYPGRQFTETVLDKILPIFFVQVEETDGDNGEIHYILGSYFVAGETPFGAYYRKDDQRSVVLFKISGEEDAVRLEVPSDAEYRAAAEVFTEQHQDFMTIQGS